MPPKMCLDCGALSPGSRCPTCQARREARRSTRRWAEHKGERYDAAFRRERARWRQVVDVQPVTCGRCGGWIGVGAAFDLDHMPDGSLHPSHPTCNRRAG